MYNLIGKKGFLSTRQPKLLLSKYSIISNQVILLKYKAHNQVELCNKYEERK